MLPNNTRFVLKFQLNQVITELNNDNYVVNTLVIHEWQYIPRHSQGVFHYIITHNHQMIDILCCKIM